MTIVYSQWSTQQVWSTNPIADQAGESWLNPLYVTASGSAVRFVKRFTGGEVREGESIAEQLSN